MSSTWNKVYLKRGDGISLYLYLELMLSSVVAVFSIENQYPFDLQMFLKAWTVFLSKCCLIH